MKWTHFIMAIYLMAVSFYPCSDTDKTIMASVAMETAHEHENHAHDEHHDTCPPFCVCNCCGLQMLNYVSSVTFDFPIPFQTIPLKESFYVSNLSDTYAGSIWQPPQLV